MLKFLGVLLLAVPLSSCAEYVWVKPGATQAELEIANGRCLASSYSSIPAAPETVMLGTGYTTPTNTNCARLGNSLNCTTTGGQYQPPASFTIDGNSGVREQVFMGCMAGHGWVRRRREESRSSTTATSGAGRRDAALPAAIQYCDNFFKDNRNPGMMASFDNNYSACISQRIIEIESIWPSFKTNR